MSKASIIWHPDFLDARVRNAITHCADQTTVPSEAHVDASGSFVFTVAGEPAPDGWRTVAIITPERDATIALDDANVTIRGLRETIDRLVAARDAAIADRDAVKLELAAAIANKAS